MATPTAFPKVPIKAWTVLRSRAANAPSTKFSPSTVAALLGMSSPKSAGDNVVYPLRRLGLFDDDGSLSARGNKWRNDATYAEACQEILDDVYPSDLSALTTDDGDPDKARITTWLQHQGFGGSNARQMASTYAMIAAKTPPDPSSTSEPRKESPRRTPAKAAPTPKSNAKASAELGKVETKSEQKPNGSGPVVHLDIKIQIPATADAQQIDAIFASMAKHLYSR